jgi:hypothetical protein
MRIKILILLILLSAENIYSQPRFTMQFTGGYSVPLPDLKGEFGPTRATFTENNPDTATFYITNGLNFGVYGKKAFGKSGNLRVVGAIIFNYFFQANEYNDSIGIVTNKLKLNILAITLGGEWSLISKNSKINPFAGADLMLNFFSGSFHQEEGSTTADYTLQSETRLGVQLGGGVDFKFSYNIGSVIGLKYSIANLVGKSGGTDVGSTYALADERYGKSRTISYLQFYGGVSFYFGY